MRVIAKDDLTLHPHTWTRGMDYELVQKSDCVTIASNEGHVNFTGESMKRLREVFIFPDESTVYGINAPDEKEGRTE